jgi:hypothetical protein
MTGCSLEERLHWLRSELFAFRAGFKWIKNHFVNLQFPKISYFIWASTISLYLPKYVSRHEVYNF